MYAYIQATVSRFKFAVVCAKITLSLYFIGMFSPVNYGFDANIASSIAEYFFIYIYIIRQKKTTLYIALDI
jgi:hypothetical protein